MGVKYYKAGEHPAGFTGFRVTVAYGDNYHQRYFSTLAANDQSDKDPYFRYQRLRAEKQDVEWQLESLRYQYHRFVTQNHPTTKPERGVGVHCITASFFLDRRKTWQAGFTVSRDQNEKGRRKPSKRFTFCTRPYSQVWKDAVLFWAEEHGIATADRDRVLATPPEPEQFKRLRRRMNEHDGFEIPVKALSAVFAEQRAEIAHKRSLQKAKDIDLTKGILNPPSAHIEAEMAAWFEREVKSDMQASPSNLITES